MHTSPARLLPVAVPGARGAFTQKAARAFFGHQCSALSCHSASDAVAAVVEGRASHAVLPVENSITGVHDGVADALFVGDVSVVGEIVLPIRHAIMAVAGTRLGDISVVTSHSAALSQCRDWIASWGLATRVSADCAAAAEQLAADGDAAVGVIGSRELGATYGLDILAEGLSDHPDNRTRFLVLGQAELVETEGLRNAVQVGPVQTPRALKTLRIQLESLGASRVRVPFLGTDDGRRFVVEFDQRSGEGFEIAARACGTLPYRFLGSWTPSERQVG